MNVKKNLIAALAGSMWLVVISLLQGLAIFYMAATGKTVSVTYVAFIPVALSIVFISIVLITVIKLFGEMNSRISQLENELANLKGSG